MASLRHLPLLLVASMVALAGAGMAQPWNETDDGNNTDDGGGVDQNVDVDDDDGGIAWVWLLIIGGILVIAVIAFVAASQRDDRYDRP